VLNDPRVRVYIDDVRSYLVKADEKYDVILSDSIHPRLAGNGGLYCTDYFQLWPAASQPGRHLFGVAAILWFVAGGFPAWPRGL